MLDFHLQHLFNEEDSIESSDSNNSDDAQQRFVLKKFIKHPIEYKIATSIPNASDIESLWKLPPDLRVEILSCLKNIYSYIVLRPYKEGAEDFFYHVGATALYESQSANPLINGKNHGLKAGSVYNQVVKTLESIQNALAKPLLSTHTLSGKQIAIALKFQADLVAHKNVLTRALKRLPHELKEHLRRHNHIDVDSLVVEYISPQETARIRNLHPQSPKQVPFNQKNTPKMTTRASDRSKKALLASEPPDIKKPLKANPTMEQAMQMALKFKQLCLEGLEQPDKWEKTQLNSKEEPSPKALCFQFTDPSFKPAKQQIEIIKVSNNQHDRRSPDSHKCK